jgi:PAS domain S-box-containing protein
MGNEKDAKTPGEGEIHQTENEFIRAENALRESELKYRTLFENCSDAIIVMERLDDKDVFVDCNPRTLEIFGRTRGEFLGSTPHELSPPYQPDGISSSEKAAQKLSAALSGIPQTFEWQHCRADGTHFYVEVSLNAIESSQKKLVQGIMRDITEDVASKQALVESEHKFRALAEKSVVGIYLIQDWLFKYVNPKYAEIHGYATDEILNKGPELTVFPEDLPMVREHLARRVSGEVNSLHHEFRVVRKDGAIREIEVYGSRTTYQGRPAIIGTLVDITERKRLENELKFKNILLSAQQEVSLDGILVVDDNGTILSFNTRFVEMLGIPVEVMETRSDEQALNVALDKLSEPDRFLQKVRHLYEHKHETSRDEINLKDGSTFDRYSSPMFGPDGHYYGRVWYFRDITRRKQAEEELEKSEARYRSLLESVLDAVYVIGTDGRFTFVNDVMTKRSGHSKEWFIGRHYLDVLRPEYWERARSAFDANMRGETVSPYEVMPSYKGLTGEDRWVEVNRTPIYEDGSVVGILGASRDITERKRMEEELRKHQDHLERLVAERTAALMESESRYRELVDNALVGVYQSRLNGELLYHNDCFVRMVEFESFEEIKASDSPLRYKNPADRKPLLRTLKETGKVTKYETEFLTRDGNTIDVLISASLNGDVISGMVLDITDRKKAEEALKTSERNLRLIFNNTHDGIIIHDVQGSILEVNDRILEMYGVSREEALGLSIIDDYSTRDQPLDQLPKVWDSVIEGTDHLFEWKNRRRDGSVFDVEVFNTKIQLGGRDLILAMVRDITERKKAEELLQESERNYRELVENALVGVYKTRLNGEILYANRTLLKMHGFTTIEEIRSAGSVYAHPEDRKTVIEMLKTKGVVQNHELELLTKGGKVINVLLSATLAGDVVSGMVRDITARKKAEAELEEKSSRLQDTNTALRVLLDQRDEDKREMEGRFRANIKSLVLPYLETLLNSSLPSRQRSVVEAMEANVHIILSPLMRNLQDHYAQFTPTEVIVADLIKEGRSTKEIAVKLSVSESAVNLHRQHIREKLGLRNSKRNLTTYLTSLSD